jgi:hypothetical protein
MRVIEHFRHGKYQYPNHDTLRYFYDWSKFSEDPRTKDVDLHYAAGVNIDYSKLDTKKINIVIGAEWPNGWFNGKRRGQNRSKLERLENDFDYLISHCKQTAAARGYIYHPIPVDVTHVKKLLEINDDSQIEKTLDVFMCGNSRGPNIQHGGPCPIYHWGQTIKKFNHVFANAMRDRPILGWHEKQKLIFKSKISVVWGDFLHTTHGCHKYSINNFDWIKFKNGKIKEDMEAIITPCIKSRIYDAAMSKSIILCYKSPFAGEFESYPYNSAIEDFFIPGEDFLYFTDCEDLEKNIIEILKNYDSGYYNKMIENAYKKLIKNLSTESYYKKCILPIAKKGKAT